MTKSSKRANGEGTIYADPPRNRWIGEIVIEGKRRRVSGKTRAQAGAALRELIRKSETGAVIVDGNASVRSLIERWLSVELPARELSASTRTRSEWQARTAIELIGDVRLRALTPEHVEGAYAALIAGEHGGKPWGRASLVGFRSTLSQVWTFGMRRGYVERNVPSVTVIPTTAQRPRARRSLTSDEARRLWEACGSHERLGAAWRVQLLTGLRPGEVAGLVWSSVDLGKSPSLTISRMVRAGAKGRPELGDGVKTAGSYRTLALAQPLVEVLRAHRIAQAEQRMAASTWDDLDLVFSTSSGGPLAPSNVRRDLAKLCVELGIEPIAPNELRHTAASLMLDLGMTKDQVADVLGHRTTRMLDQHYAHSLRPLVSSHVDTVTELATAWGS